MLMWPGVNGNINIIIQGILLTSTLLVMANLGSATCNVLWF